MIEVQLDEIIERLKSLPVVGIYLYGSRSRGEIDKYSDLDLLIVVENSEVREKIKKLFPDIDINIFSEESLKKYLELNPSYIIALREAVTLYGKPVEMLDIPDPDPVGMLAELKQGKERVQKLRDFLDDVDEGITDLVVYVTILRVRQAFAIERLYYNKKFSKEEFLRLLDEIGIGRRYYEYYRLAREDRLNITLSREELEKLIDSAERYITGVFDKIAHKLIERVKA